MPSPAIDLTKFTYEEFCKALYGSKTAADVAELVRQDYKIELPKTKDREAMLRAAYEAVCKGKAPAPTASEPPPAPVAGRYRVRVRNPELEARGRAGLRFTRAWATHTLTAEQAAAIKGDPHLQIVAC
jgi:hypothetical protein